MIATSLLLCACAFLSSSSDSLDDSASASDTATEQSSGSSVESDSNTSDREDDEEGRVDGDWDVASAGPSAGPSCSTRTSRSRIPSRETFLEAVESAMRVTFDYGYGGGVKALMARFGVSQRSVERYAQRFASTNPTCNENLWSTMLRPFRARACMIVIVCTQVRRIAR